TMGHSAPRPSVVVVGGGFAGIGCARALDRHDVDVTVIDRNDYHQFQPLLYQVATAELASSDVARPLRAIFARQPNVAVRQVEVTAVDPATRRSEEHTSELQSRENLVCRLLLEKKKKP